MGNLRDREVAYSESDLQGFKFESYVWRAVSSHHRQEGEAVSSHHSQEVLLVQFNMYVHKSGLIQFILYVHLLECGNRLQTLESKVDPRTERVNY